MRLWERLKMAWTRIDDNFKNNIKVRKAGGDGVLLYLYGLIHCNTNLTDGYIDEVYLPQLFADAFCKRQKATLNKLLEVGLWIKVDGGYQVNDFLEYNLTKEEVEKRRKAKVEAGRKGGRASSESKQETDDEVDDGAPAQADAQADAQAKINPITHNPYPLPISPKTNTAAAAFFGKNPELYIAFEPIKPVDEQTKKDIDSAVEIYSVGWVRDAIAEAVKKGDVRSFRYIESILKRWQKEGRNSKRAPVKPDERSADTFRKARQQMRQA